VAAPALHSLLRRTGANEASVITKTKAWFIRQTTMLADLSEREHELLDQVS